MNIRNTLATLFIVFCASAVQAQSPSYTYIGAGYSNTGDLGGPFVEGSVSITENFFVGGGFSRIRGGDWEDVDLWTAGFGYAFSLGDHADLVTSAAWGRYDISFDSYGRSGTLESEGGYGKLEYRRRVNEIVELAAHIGYADFQYVDADVIYGVDASFFVKPYLSVFFGLGDSNDSNEMSFSVGLRLVMP